MFLGVYMAKITVKFYSLWALYLNKNSISLEACNLDDVIEELDILFGKQIRKKINKNNIKFDNFKNSSTILVNGVSLRNIKDTQLKDGDLIQMFPPIARSSIRRPRI